MFRFKCTCCDEWHERMPGFGADAPLYYYGIPAAERDSRCTLTSETCVVDDSYFFVHGNIEIAVHGQADPFIWGVWVSLSKTNFGLFKANLTEPKRSHIGPFFGWLSAELPLYPSTVSLKTRIHLRDNGVRPWVELEPTDHPLAVEQRNGISVERVAEIFGYHERQGKSPG
jgi:hypothetical protein